MAPLMSVEKIENRLDAVNDLITFQSETDTLRARFAKLPDLEKLLAKIFTYSIKHSVKAIYFEDVSLQKMKEFRTLLNCFKDIEDTLGSLRGLHRRGELKSERLIALVSTKQESDIGLLPEDIAAAIHEFDQLIRWKRIAGANNAEIPEPQPGIDEVFDNANEAVNNVKDRLNDVL